MQRLAIYDMDRTVTRHATFTPFLLLAARQLAPWRLLLVPLLPVLTLPYLLRLVSRARLKEWCQRLLIGDRVPLARLAPVVARFTERTLATNIRPGARRQLAADRASGHRLVLATASFRFYAEPIGRALGFDDVVATGSAGQLDQLLRARLDGENNYGAAKLRLVTAWLVAAGIPRAAAEIRFYSDHVSDHPTLAWADTGIAVNPSRGLRRMARRRGWERVDWRR